jgi:hypothetical protein
MNSLRLALNIIKAQFRVTDNDSSTGIPLTIQAEEQRRGGMKTSETIHFSGKTTVFLL